MTEETDYQARLAEEHRHYKDNEDVHGLPAIFHYWSEKYVRPRLRAFGFDGLMEFLAMPIQWQLDRNPGRTVRCLSIGSGNCDQEIQIALWLRARRLSEFKIECLDLNETMLDRGREAASRQGLTENFIFKAGDFNKWRPEEEYDAVLANQALHHVVELEHLFTAIKDGLRPTGVFIVSDMIGRNGHLRWPEAMSIVQEFWRKLPPSYRYNRQLRRYEERFEDWDCSQECFEGIRAQDILPLLHGAFHFERFLALSNVIDPFVDRSFGHHFDASAEWDRAFIDAVQARDEEELRRGTIKPTHMWAILSPQDNGSTWFEEPFSPAFCIRAPGVIDESSVVAPSEPYLWEQYPHDKARELQLACNHLAEAQAGIRERDGKIERAMVQLRVYEGIVEDRTEWALKMKQELQEKTEWALRLDQELNSLRDSLGKSGRAALRVVGALRSRMRHLGKRQPKLER